LNVTNGGVLRVAILRVIRPLIWYERFEFLSQGKHSYNISEANQNISQRTQVQNPFYVYYSIPRGELLFFKKPKDVLRLTISTEKQVYMPGD